MILSIAIMFDEYFFHQLFARYDSQQLQFNLVIFSPIVSNSYHSNHHFYQKSVLVRVIFLCLYLVFSLKHLPQPVILFLKMIRLIGSCFKYFSFMVTHFALLLLLADLIYHIFVYLLERLLHFMNLIIFFEFLLMHPYSPPSSQQLHQG